MNNMKRIMMKIWNYELKVSKYYSLGLLDLIVIGVVLIFGVMWVMLLIEYINTDWGTIEN
jgi:hypothetical protein